MDYKLGIPVHGESVKATLDFPGAGSATIDATKLGKDQTTNDPFNFAVSAVLAGTAQGLVENDTSVTFSQKTFAKNDDVTSDANEGYRFMGWFRECDVAVDSIGEDAAWFKGKTDDDAVKAGKRVSECSGHDKNSSYTADNANGSDAFKDNDLFIASYEAQVLFHDSTGAVLDATAGTESVDTSDDWYRYATSITPAIPQTAPASASATFIGWTNKANVAAGSNGAYVGISSGDLSALKSAGAFFPVGSAITVTEPMDFYPVYTDYASNVITVFEGNEQDSSSNTTLREGVGSTTVASTTSGTSTEYTIKVLDASGKALSDGGELPDGYRFLGWYETKQVNGGNVDVRVSRGASYELPADVDLTVPHTYTARFEYRVDYYGTTTRLQDSAVNNPFVEKDANGNFVAKAYASNWQGYQTAFVERGDAPLDSEDAFAGWFEGAGTVNHGKASSCSAAQVTSSKKITEPFSVHAHVTGDNTTYDIYITDDFPGAATLSNSGNPGLSSFTVNAQVNDGYAFSFWDCQRDGSTTNDTWISDNNPWKAGAQLTTHTYAYTAHLLAKVNFYWKDGTKVNREINGRAYQEKLLSGELREYTYPITGDHISGKDHSGNPGPSASDMAVSGYKFLGWITTAEVQKDSAVWNYIYDVTDDNFTTSDPAKAEPYLVTDDYRVTQAQDVYPVYAKYNVGYDTSLHRAGFNGNDTVNAPSWNITPKLSEKNGTVTATVKPDITTTVYKNGTEKYQLTKMTLESPDGQVEELKPGDDDTYSAAVDAGGAYAFVAYYTPLAVVYHLNGSDIDGKIAQAGDTLGKLNGGIPKPTFDVADIDAAAGGYHQFVGWTAAVPAGGVKYVIWTQSTNLVTAGTVVNEPMELYPVYRVTSITVNSNIDSVLSDPSSVRGLTRTSSGDQISLQVKAAEEVQGADGATYDFVGWSRDYAGGDTYTLLTSDKDYALEGSEPFASATYTAVYKKSPWKIRYHDATGDVVYEADVEQGDARATGKGFVHDVEVPKVDDSGNPVYDEDGKQETETQTVAYDSDAYIDESQDLASRAAGHGGVYKEMFLEWQAVGADGKMVAWDDFKNKPVSGDMDLYPKTFYVVAHDTSNGMADETTNVTPKLKWQLDPKASGEVSSTADHAPIKACFADKFDGTQLTISVKRVAYSVDENKQVTASQEPSNDKSVSLYSAGDGSGSFALDDRLATKVTGSDDQGEGNAVFDFPATHALTVVKQTADASAEGKTFRFKVTKKGADTAQDESRTVSVTVGAASSAKDDDGNALYTGKTVIMVPSGTYTVEEDGDWAWRYKSSMIAPDGKTGSSATVSVSAASSVGDATVTCTNKRAKSEWIDGSSRISNVWSDSKTVESKER